MLLLQAMHLKKLWGNIFRLRQTQHPVHHSLSLIFFTSSLPKSTPFLLILKTSMRPELVILSIFFNFQVISVSKQFMVLVLAFFPKQVIFSWMGRLKFFVTRPDIQPTAVSPLPSLYRLFVRGVEGIILWLMSVATSIKLIEKSLPGF